MRRVLRFFARFAGIRLTLHSLTSRIVIDLPYLVKIKIECVCDAVLQRFRHDDAGCFYAAFGKKIRNAAEFRKPVFFVDVERVPPRFVYEKECGFYSRIAG